MTMYEMRRETLLANIFDLNLQIGDDIDPFAYKPDVYETLLHEQFILYDGGDAAIEWARRSIDDTKALIEEFEPNEETINLCLELADMYEEYINTYAEKKGEVAC